MHQCACNREILMDILRKFRKCRFCNDKKHLSVVTQCELYNTTYYYYHPECVRRVLANPEQYSSYVDTAIAITDHINEQLESHRQNVERQNRGLERAWNTIRTLDNIMTGSIDEQNRTGSPVPTWPQPETQP